MTFRIPTGRCPCSRPAGPPAYVRHSGTERDLDNARTFNLIVTYLHGIDGDGERGVVPGHLAVVGVVAGGAGTAPGVGGAYPHDAEHDHEQEEADADDDDDGDGVRAAGGHQTFAARHCVGGWREVVRDDGGGTHLDAVSVHLVVGHDWVLRLWMDDCQL